MSKPPLPHEVRVNQFLNVVPHDASIHAENANANIGILWAEHAERNGFNPEGVTFDCFGRIYRIGMQNGKWQMFRA
jgi:hypothetical protein